MAQQIDIAAFNEWAIRYVATLSLRKEQLDAAAAAQNRVKMIGDQLNAYTQQVVDQLQTGLDLLHIDTKPSISDVNDALGTLVNDTVRASD